MLLELFRRWKTPYETIGELYNDGVYFCYTLEDAIRDKKIPNETAIPCGRYDVITNYSVRFKRVMPLILNVPGFTGVRIHAGNTKADIKYLSIETLMERFVWVEDKAGDWTPWVMTIICQSFKDDCDGAANLARWWFKQNGVEAEILNLYSDKSGHTVCVTKNRETMVTNERVVSLNPACWEKEMLEYFGGKYTEII